MKTTLIEMKIFLEEEDVARLLRFGVFKEYEVIAPNGLRAGVDIYFGKFNVVDKIVWISFDPEEHKYYFHLYDTTFMNARRKCLDASVNPCAVKLIKLLKRKKISYVSKVYVQNLK